MGAALAAQQSSSMHTRRPDAHCVQLSLRSQSSSPHAQQTRTHDPLLTDLDLHPDCLSSTSQRERMTDLRHLKHCQLFIPGLSVRRLLADRPQLRKHKEKMISFQLGRAQGNFPAVFTYSERRFSRPHVRSRGALIWLRLCHGHT